ncbi:MAG: hypothetical protein ACLP4V_20640 [Methylocella sp.]
MAAVQHFDIRRVIAATGGWSRSPVCWSNGMPFGKVFKVLVVLSLTATGAAMARDKSKVPVSEKGKTVNLVKGDKAGLVKGDKAGAKNGQVQVSVRHATPQAPIVMGRSISVHHKTKLHHVKINSLESIDASVSANVSH